MPDNYDPRSALNSRQGRINRREGAEFEKMIELSCDYYKQKGIAFIEKTPEPFRITSKPNAKGQFTGYFTKQAQPDFKGTVSGGRSIVFDAKATSTEKIPLSALTEEQTASLQAHADLGALAYLFMSYSFMPFYLMPYNVFVRAKEIVGHKYWTADECEFASRITAAAELPAFPVRFTGTFLEFMEGICTTKQF